MKTRIAAGETLETLTPAEFEDALRRVLGETSSTIWKGPQTMRLGDGITLDGSGNGTLGIYIVPAGMEFALHRLFITDDTHTPASPFTNASGYAYILRNGVSEEFVNFSAAAGGFPALQTWAVANAIRFRNKERVEIQFVGGPVSKMVYVRAQGTLQPLTEA